MLQARLKGKMVPKALKGDRPKGDKAYLYGWYWKIGDGGSLSWEIKGDTGGEALKEIKEIMVLKEIPELKVL